MAESAIEVVADAQAILKVIFTPRKIQDLTFLDNTLLALWRKMTKFGGQGTLKIPVRVNQPAGSSANFGAAQASQNIGNLQAFQLTRQKEYGIWTASGEALLASEGDANAFMSVEALNIDGIFKNVARNMNIAGFRDGTGVRGIIAQAADIASTTGILLGTQTGTTGDADGAGANAANSTLCSPYDDVNLETDMSISLAYYTPAAGAVPGFWSYRSPQANGGATAVILGIDPVAHTFTVAGQAQASAAVSILTLIPDAAVGDFIVRSGDLQGGSTKGVMAGMGGWLPISAPGSTDSWFGVNRSFVPFRLAGFRGSNIGGNPEDVLIALGSGLKNQSAKPDAAFLSYENMNTLITTLNAKKTYADGGMHRDFVPKDTKGVPKRTDDDAEISFRGVMVKLAHGDVAVFMDNCCPYQVCYMITTDDWQVASLGGVPLRLGLDGLTMRALPNADAYETRIGCYGNFSCEAPAHSGVMQIH